MKNCNNPCEQQLQLNPCPRPCSDPCDRTDHIIKLFVDDCTGRPLDPVTQAEAVFTADCETVQSKITSISDLVELLQQQLSNLEHLTIDDTNINSLIVKIQALEDLDITDLEGILLAIREQLGDNSDLFATLLQNILQCDCSSGGEGGGGSTPDLSNYATKSYVNNKLDPINSSITQLRNDVKELNDAIETIPSGTSTVINNSTSNLIGGVVYNEIALEINHENSANDVTLESLQLDPNNVGYYYITSVTDYNFNDNEEPEEVGKYKHYYGDMNDDGIPDVEDLNAIINIILGLDTNPTRIAAADYNGDHVVDVEDVNGLINRILKLDSTDWRFYYNTTPTQSLKSPINRTVTVQYDKITRASDLHRELEFIRVTIPKKDGREQCETAIINIIYQGDVTGYFETQPWITYDGHVTTISGVVSPKLYENLRTFEVELTTTDPNFPDPDRVLVNFVASGDYCTHTTRIETNRINESSSNGVRNLTDVLELIREDSDLNERYSVLIGSPQIIYTTILPSSNGNSTKLYLVRTHDIESINIEPHTLYYRKTCVTQGNPSLVYFDWDYNVHTLS